MELGFEFRFSASKSISLPTVTYYPLMPKEKSKGQLISSTSSQGCLNAVKDLGNIRKYKIKLTHPSPFFLLKEKKSSIIFPPKEIYL